MCPCQSPQSSQSRALVETHFHLDLSQYARLLWNIEDSGTRSLLTPSLSNVHLWQTHRQNNQKPQWPKTPQVLQSSSVKVLTWRQVLYRLRNQSHILWATLIYPIWLGRARSPQNPTPHLIWSNTPFKLKHVISVPAAGSPMATECIGGQIWWLSRASHPSHLQQEYTESQNLPFVSRSR